MTQAFTDTPPASEEPIGAPPPPPAAPARARAVPRHTKLVLLLLGFVILWFGLAAIGTRIGVWGWQFGFLTMTLGGGLIVLGVTALVALISLVIAARAKPRRNLPVAIAILGLLVPGAAMLMFVSARGKAEDNPIHDIATDTANPPAFSAETLAAREEAGANPLSNYQVPLGQLELFRGKVAPELEVQSHAQIITDRDDRPAPLPLAGKTREEGVAAVAAAMGAMGIEDIRADPAAGIVEGVARSTWFGFEDDVVARIGDAQIDFRSASRVGISDLGANTARIVQLRERTENLLGQASR